ncbi:alpha/beta hydrolase [Pantoea sp. B65]
MRTGGGPSAQLRCKTALVVILLFLLTGCAGDPLLHADQMARSAGLQRETVQATPFALAAWVRITRADQPLHIYIEGDGRAWRNRYQPSDDPTPRKAIGLSLAVADSAPNVLYLARPCQFVPMTQNPRCQTDYWTGKRFAPEVIAAMDQAMTHYLSRTPGQPIILTGYSGGAAVAALLAARRSDVTLLRTVAGNLDHRAINRFHKVSPMPDSLNPADEVARIATIPQRHFSGAEDNIVPPFIGRDFAAAVGKCASWQLIPNIGHEGDWSQIWPQLLRQKIQCGDKK